MGQGSNFYYSLYQNCPLVDLVSTQFASKT